MEEDIRKKVFRNLAEGVMNNTQDVLSELRNRERYIVDFMRELYDMLSDVLDYDGKEVTQRAKPKITINEAESVIIESHTGFGRREAWMTDDELLKAMSGYWRYFNIENNRKSFRKVFKEIQEELDGEK